VEDVGAFDIARIDPSAMAASTRRCKASGTMPEVSAKSSEFRSKRMRRLCAMPRLAAI
jgi:hypothetical protein